MQGLIDAGLISPERAAALQDERDPVASRRASRALRTWVVNRLNSGVHHLLPIRPRKMDEHT
jgi:hypothetical protein